jgi:hypothetical protein
MPHQHPRVMPRQPTEVADGQIDQFGKAFKIHWGSSITDGPMFEHQQIKQRFFHSPRNITDDRVKSCLEIGCRGNGPTTDDQIDSFRRTFCASKG